MSRSFDSSLVRRPTPQARAAAKLTAGSRTINAVRATSQIRAVLSEEAVTMRLPSGLSDAAETDSRVQSSRRTLLPRGEPSLDQARGEARGDSVIDLCLVSERAQSQFAAAWTGRKSDFLL